MGSFTTAVHRLHSPTSLSPPLSTLPPSLFSCLPLLSLSLFLPSSPLSLSHTHSRYLYSLAFFSPLAWSKGWLNHFRFQILRPTCSSGTYCIGTRMCETSCARNCSSVAFSVAQERCNVASTCELIHYHKTVIETSKPAISWTSHSPAPSDSQHQRQAIPKLEPWRPGATAQRGSGSFKCGSTAHQTWLPLMNRETSLE